LFTGGVVLLLLLTLAPIASAQPGYAPALQATDTPVPTVAPTDTPAATDTAEPTTAAGTVEATPEVLPETGAGDNTPGMSVPFMLVLIGALIVVAGAAVAVVRRPQ
jgi:hypothetical protein